VLVVSAAAVGIAAAAFATVRLVGSPVEQLSSGVAAAEETAPPASPSAAAAPVASILDASGYVVARRQATVSAKITGKVVAVLIEEGQRVEAGEILARLDDANARAQAVQAAALVEQQRANLTAARVAFDNAGPTFDRTRTQFAAAFVSAQVFDEAKGSYARRTRPSTSPRVRSPSRKRASPSCSAISTTPSCARRSRAS
jgi:multidrug efflux pump subunit AcrA (membrane-fusion protein)